MPDHPIEDATLLLQRASAARSPAVDGLMVRVYDELRALAASYLKGERVGHTLSATSLVHEAYLRLIDQTRVQWRDRAHFFAVAAQAIRRILIDHARGKQREKRGGGAATITLHPDAAATLNREIGVLALDEGLQRLAALHPRQAQIVELRFFAGMAIEEIAGVLGVAPRTVDGDWAMARAWLRQQLDRGAP